MPRTVAVEVFKFDELDDDAKERAREWWRGLEAQDFDPDSVIEDFDRIGEILGLSLCQVPVRLMGGGVRYESDIAYSLAYSQGDGASFRGDYAYKAGAPKAIREYAPQDKALHAIADNLQKAQRPYFYRLKAATAPGRSAHSASMTVDVVDHNGDAVTDSAEDNIKSELRDLADWLFARIRDEYEYTMSEENVDEAIRANEYEFTQEGRRA